MIRPKLFALIALTLAIWPAAAFAADTRVGVIVGQTKEGLEVSSVVGGTVGGSMGFQKGDKILSYSSNGSTAKKPLKPTEMDELLTGKPGKYVITVGREKSEQTISGVVKVKDDGKTLFFLPGK